MSFELKFFVCRHVSIWGFQNRVCLSVRLSVRLSVCLSVRPHPEKRNHHSFVNISPTLVIDTSMERSSRVLHHGNPKIWFFFSKKFEIRILTFDDELKSPYFRQYLSYNSNWYINGKVFTSTTPWKSKNLIFFQRSSKFEFWFLTKSWNHLSFVNISPTLVIDTLMDRSSRVLHHGNPKNLIYFSKKFEIRILTFDEELKSPQLRQYQSYISNWYINGKVFTSTTPWKPHNLIFFFFQKSLNLNFQTFPRLSVRREKKLPWLCWYQSYISNWYINRKVFTSTTTKNFIFSKKFEIEFDLYFDLCWRAEINIQVGRNMHLYVVIGDASSSLWGSTSSLKELANIFRLIH